VIDQAEFEQAPQRQWGGRRPRHRRRPRARRRRLILRSPLRWRASRSALEA